MKAKVCIGMSGGVDSSVSALLLVRTDMECMGATMLLGTPDDAENASSARAVCERIGIPHVTFDLTEAFEREVIASFLEGHRACQTPNPCVTCNRAIKFGAFLDLAEERGCTHIATGHYLRREEGPSSLRILRATDDRKDQSYFLSRVPCSALKRALFPLGGLRKPEVVRMAEEVGLPSASRKESQDICFIQGSCADFLREHLGTQPGRIVDGHGRELGQHDGAHLFTIGQRKGLGVAVGHPAYVCAKDAAANEVVLGDRDDVRTSHVSVEDLNWISAPPPSCFSCTVKLRYNMEAAPCAVTLEGARAHLAFSSPVFAPAPGQTAALYDGDALLGGGRII